jgi:hypothetical protein
MFNDEIYLRLAKVIYRDNYIIVDNYQQVIITKSAIDLDIGNTL